MNGGRQSNAPSAAGRDSDELVLMREARAGPVGRAALGLETAERGRYVLPFVCGSWHHWAPPRFLIILPGIRHPGSGSPFDEDPGAGGTGVASAHAGVAVGIAAVCEATLVSKHRGIAAGSAPAVRSARPTSAGGTRPRLGSA